MADGDVGRAEGAALGPRIASLGAAGLAVALGAVVALAGLAVIRVVALVLGALMVLLAVGLWRRWPPAVLLGVLVGGVTVWGSVPTLLGAGDDVYEHVPSAYDALVPAIGLALGVVLLVGAAASVEPAGRVGRGVALVAVALGLVLGALGLWRLLEPREVSLTARSPVACGSVLRPSGGRSTPGACWEALVPARRDGRQLLSWGVVLTVGGLGLAAGQFGGRAWPGVVVALGAGALATAWAVGSVPLLSVACQPLNESYTGPVCDGLRHALTGATAGYAGLGAVLVVAGAIGLTRPRPSSTGAGRAPQVSA